MIIIVMMCVKCFGVLGKKLVRLKVCFYLFFYEFVIEVFKR